MINLKSIEVNIESRLNSPDFNARKTVQDAINKCGFSIAEKIEELIIKDMNKQLTKE